LWPLHIGLASIYAPTGRSRWCRPSWRAAAVQVNHDCAGARCSSTRCWARPTRRSVGFAL